jgi:hypothetical protein
MSSPKILAFHGRISDRPSALSIAQKALEDSPAESGSRGFVPHCSYKSQALAKVCRVTAISVRRPFALTGYWLRLRSAREERLCEFRRRVWAAMKRQEA